MSKNFNLLPKLSTEAFINALDTILDANEESIPEIPEYVFTSIYIPLLLKSKEDPFSFNEKWISNVSKSPYLPVYIVDNNGNRKHKLPALVNSFDTANGEFNKNSLIKNYDGNDIRVQILFNESLLSQNVKASRDNKIAIEWIKIINSYGYKLDVPKQLDTINTLELDWDE